MSPGASLLRYLPPDFDFSTINFTDPADRKPTIYAVNIVCLSLSILFVSLRICSRLLVVRKIGLDDVLIVLSLILAAALSAVTICAAKYHGLGKHVWTLPLQNISTTVQTLTKLFYVIAILYTASLTAVKSSILAFYLIKLCPPSINLRHSTFRILTISLMILIGLLFIISTFITVFQCRPVNAAWNFTIPNRKCIEITHFYYAQNGINIFTDVAIYILPIPMLWKMMLPIRQRIIVCTVMGIGAFVCIASILRLYHLVSEVGESIDLTWVMVNVANYSILEAHIGIFCASIPSIKPLVVHIFPRLLGTRNRSFVKSRTQRQGNNDNNSNNNKNNKNNNHHINNVHHRKESWMAQAPGESVVNPNVAPLRIPTANDIELARQKGRKNSKGEIRDPFESLLNSPPPMEPEEGRRRFFGSISRRLSSAAWLRGGSIPNREETDTTTTTTTTTQTTKKPRPPSLRISIPKQLRILGIGQPSGEAVDLEKYSIKTKSPPPLPASRSQNNSVSNSSGNRKRKNSNTPLGAIGSITAEEEARIISPTSLSPSTNSYATSATMISPVQPSNSSRMNAPSPLPSFNLVSGAIIGAEDSDGDVTDTVPAGHPYSHVYNNNSGSRIDGLNVTSGNGGSESHSGGGNLRSASPATNFAGIRDSKEQENAFRWLLLSASRVPEISEVSSESDESEKEEK